MVEFNQSNVPVFLWFFMEIVFTTAFVAVFTTTASAFVLVPPLCWTRKSDVGRRRAPIIDLSVFNMSAIECSFLIPE